MIWHNSTESVPVGFAKKFFFLKNMFLKDLKIFPKRFENITIKTNSMSSHLTVIIQRRFGKVHRYLSSTQSIFQGAVESGNSLLLTSGGFASEPYFSLARGYPPRDTDSQDCDSQGSDCLRPLV